MKKTLFTLLVLISAYSVFAQREGIRYDDGPIKVINATGFVLGGNWNRPNITFRFINGTTDIANNGEHTAVRQAFQIWSDYAQLNFTELTTGTADISISWATGNHGDGAPFDGTGGARNVLAHAFFPGSGLGGDVHFDDAEAWTTAERPPFSGQPIDLVTVAAHEIGHALGLDHSPENCALMAAEYNGSHRYLAPDDIAGIRNLYGNRNPILTNATAPSVCTSAVYFLRNVPTGATVNWTSSNTGIATVANAGNQGTVTRVGSANANITLTATLTLPCGVNVVETRIIAIGAPVTISYGMSGGCSSGWQGWYANAGPANMGSSWSWTVGTLTGGSQINIYSPSSPSTNLGVKGGGAVRLNYTDICGTARQDGITVYSTCPPFRVMISPNPVKDNMSISFTDAAAEDRDAVIQPVQRMDSKGMTIFSLYEINSGSMMKQWKFNEVKTEHYNVNTGGLRKGVYILQTDRDNITTVTRLVVE